MIRILFFVIGVLVSIYLVLYSGQSMKVALYYGTHKLMLNFWFVCVLLLCSYLLLHWMLQKLMAIINLPALVQRYRKERKARDEQFSRSQAIIYALAEEYHKALSHLPKSSLLSDRILRATWLNQVKDIEALDHELGQIQADGGVTDAWMIWFRAYLLGVRGKESIAAGLLLDCLEAGVVHALVAKSFVEYCAPKVHYQALLKHYHQLSRYVEEAVLHCKIRDGLCFYMDELIEKKDWKSLDVCLRGLPRKMQKDQALVYYFIKDKMAINEVDKALGLFQQADFGDHRMIMLLVEFNISVSRKLELIQSLLVKQPKNRDLIYLSSYLYAQSGAIDDSVKMLEGAWKVE